MKVGFMGTTMKRNTNRPRRKHPASPWVKKVRQVKSSVKSVLIYFFDAVGIVHKDFVLPGQMINVKFDCSILRWLRGGAWGGGGRINGTWTHVCHHDNVLAHTTSAVQQFLTSKNMTVILLPPYSPDLALCDFFLFPKIKIKLRGWRFDTILEIQAELQKVLETFDTKGLPGHLPIMAKMLASLCTLPRGLPLRGIVAIRTSSVPASPPPPHFFFLLNTFWELLDSTLCVLQITGSIKSVI